MILITGATGFVGSHLLYLLLQRKEQVRAIYRSESKIDAVRQVFSYYTQDKIQIDALISRVDWFKADITEVPTMVPAFAGVTKVYHCAALVSFDPSDYVEMRKVNIHGTAIVVNLCIDARVKKLCFVSSIAAIGDSVDGQPIDETCEWNKNADNSGYAITKFGAEMEVWRASQEGVAVVILNPGVILGSGFWNSGTGQIFDKIYKGFPYYTEGVTGFIGVKDVAKALWLSMESQVETERFILVSENKTYHTVFDEIADAFGKKRPTVAIKKWQTAILWRISATWQTISGRKAILSKYTARSLHSVSHYTSQKVKKELAIELAPVHEVVVDVCQDYLSK